MARLALFLGALAPFLNSPARADGNSIAIASGQYVAGELLVKFKDGPSSTRAQQIRTQVGATAVKTYNKLGWQKVKLPAGVSTIKGLEQLGMLAGVAAVEPNYRRYPTKTPSDTLYPQQYHHARINTPAAWDVTTGSSEVVVAVLDTGVNKDHIDLARNRFFNPGEIPDNDVDDDGNGYVDDVSGWDFADDDDDPDDDGAEPGHGSHCAGLVGAVGDNALGVTGVNWNVKILPLRFLGDGGGSVSDEIDAYEYMIGLKQRGVNLRIVNCSYGSVSRSAAEQEVMIRAGQAGILSVVAAGNGNARGVGQNIDLVPEYPAAFETDYILTVAASDENDNPTSFTNYGARGVDLAAPGANILSTYAEIDGDDDTYAYLSGTSMATPITAGAAALILANDSSLSPLALKARLIATVDKLPQWKGKVLSGGRLNVALAVGGNLSITGSITGVNTSGATVALPGATVTVVESGRTVTADSTGSYTLGQLISGTYTLVARASGYQDSTQTVTLDGAGGSADFELDADAVTYGISGRVTEIVNGSPVGVEGVQIFLDGNDIPVATTDFDGNYAVIQRSAGTYDVTAFKDGYEITPSDATPGEIDLPETGSASAPNAVVNFDAVSTPDFSAPDVTILSPEDGATIEFSSGNGTFITATGTATDPQGVTKLFYMLARQQGRKLQYYNWAKRNWGAKPTTAGAVLTRNVSGRTDLNWTQALPKLTQGTYVLSVSGQDGAGNTSDGTADAVSTFTVQKVAKSRGKAGALSTPTS